MWQSTCFEIFLGDGGSAAYTEVNLSPSGAWNTYRFTGLRQGMQQDEATQALDITATAPPHRALTASIHCGRQMQQLRLGLSAVIEHQSEHPGGLSYFSLAHPFPASLPSGGKPDFHHPNGHICLTKTAYSL